MTSLKTLGGWVIIVSLGGLYYYLTKRRSSEKPPRKAAAAKLPYKALSTLKEPKARKARKDGALNSGDDKKHKNKGLTPEVSQSYSNVPATYDPEEDNREFARQLSRTKTGTVMASKSEKASRQKSVKQSQALEKPAPETSSDNATAPSSATGGDADDDQSSANSPDLVATEMTSPVARGGMSDMLEQQPSKPVILRVTEPMNPTQPKRAKPQPSFEPVESKKQRQNRQKSEAKKLARVEEEKDRKILEERQRRTARIAEGRAAKDGSTFMAASAPSMSAWKAPAPASPSVFASNGGKGADNKVDFLDTFEPSSSASAAGNLADPQYSESEQAGSDWHTLAQNLPSEEEQLKFALEDSDNWKTVTAKEKRKVKKLPTDSNAMKDDQHNSGGEQDGYGVPRVITPTGPGKKWAVTLVHVEPNGEVVEHERELQDSEWEVS